MAKLLAVAGKNNWELGFSEKNKPDKAWLITMLATYKRDDEIFAKGYVAPAIKKKKPEEKTIAVPKTLFDGLPQKKLGKRRKRTRLEITKDAK